jgi:hypothetical protein
MKYAKISGKGSVLLRGSGDRSTVDVSNDIAVKIV